MKHTLLLILLLAAGPQLLPGQTTPTDNPPLPKPSGRQLKQAKRASLEYLNYLVSSSSCPSKELTAEGSPFDSTLLPWLRFGPASHPDTILTRAFCDSLYIIEPDDDEETAHCLHLVSRYPAIPGLEEENIQTAGFTGLFPYRPSNPKMEGLQTSTLSPLGNTMMRITYAFQDDEGHPILLTDDYEQAYFRTSTSGGWTCHDFRFHFRDSSRTFRDIASGMIEIELVTPAEYDYATFTANDTGKTLYLGDQPVRLTAFGPGYLHLSYPHLDARLFQQANLAFFRGDQQLPQQLLAGGIIEQAFYDYARTHPGLTPRKFAARQQEIENKSAGEFVEVLWSGNDADRVVLYTPRQDQSVAARVVVFHRNEAGEFHYSLLRKGHDGVYRPLGGDPEGVTPPEYHEGREAMFRTIFAAIVYPDEAIRRNIQGTVYVSATIDRNGAMTAATVQRSVDPLLDAEALRVVRLLKEWTPATREGEAVEMNVLIPVRFQLQ